MPFHECGLEEYIFLMLSSIQYDDVNYYCKDVGAACPGVDLYGNDSAGVENFNFLPNGSYLMESEGKGAKFVDNFF